MGGGMGVLVICLGNYGLTECWKKMEIGWSGNMGNWVSVCFDSALWKFGWCVRKFCFGKWGSFTCGFGFWISTPKCAGEQVFWSCALGFFGLWVHLVSYRFLYSESSCCRVVSHGKWICLNWYTCWNWYALISSKVNLNTMTIFQIKPWGWGSSTLLTIFV